MTEAVYQHPDFAAANNQPGEELSARRSSEAGSSGYSGRDDVGLTGDLDSHLETLAAIGDLIGSVNTESLSEDTIPCVGALIQKMLRQANEMAAELWSRRLATDGASADLCESEPPRRGLWAEFDPKEIAMLSDDALRFAADWERLPADEQVAVRSMVQVGKHLAAHAAIGAMDTETDGSSTGGDE